MDEDPFHPIQWLHGPSSYSSFPARGSTFPDICRLGASQEEGMANGTPDTALRVDSPQGEREEFSGRDVSYPACDSSCAWEGERKTSSCTPCISSFSTPSSWLYIPTFSLWSREAPLFLLFLELCLAAKTNPESSRTQRTNIIGRRRQQQ